MKKDGAAREGWGGGGRGRKEGAEPGRGFREGRKSELSRRPVISERVRKLQPGGGFVSRASWVGVGHRLRD